MFTTSLTETGTRRLSLAVLAVCALIAVAGDGFAQSATPAAFVSNNGNLEGSVTSYTFNPDGSPNFVQKIIIGERESTSDYEPGCNAYCISITPNGRYLATGHASSDDPLLQVTVLEVASDATMTVLVEQPHPDTPLDIEWLNDRYLAALSTEFGTLNQVIVYEFDPNVPSLTEVDRGDCSTFTSSLAVHPSGELLYAADSNANRVYPFEVNADGTLTALASTATGSTYPLGVSVSPDGAKLYAYGGISSGGHAVLGYHILPDGTLGAMTGMPFNSPGSSPKAGAFSVDSSILFVGHGSDATARSFMIDEETGAINYTGNSFDVGIQGELGSLAVLDDYLLVTDNFLGDRGLYSFDIQPDGGFTMNGAIVDSQGINPREIAVWSPPACPADLDGDGYIGLSDLAELLAAFGACTGDPFYNADADFDSSGCVDLSDLAYLLSVFDQACP